MQRELNTEGNLKAKTEQLLAECTAKLTKQYVKQPCWRNLIALLAIALLAIARRLRKP